MALTSHTLKQTKHLETYLLLKRGPGTAIEDRHPTVLIFSGEQRPANASSQPPIEGGIAI
ncbi:hypothetical protein [Bradyrhizobium sp. WD16]|uniref:hypothetical protein n=1 Tax=Bradyrhizobium sp. WD16 TaxID=1521768 RepID=UPI0020A40CF3|nr:hypothetical protein [Bradyrhizobium sp. WD16]UTD26260.1 hypothetical protein DB459_04290 [Bradyrhizobium sp. WD16]